MTWQFVLTGLLIGTLVGMTGMGGGSLMTPILVIVFGFKPTLAVGTDIVHGAIFKTVGAIRHRRLGTVHAQLSGWMFTGSAPLSLIGVVIATRITHQYGDSATTVMGYMPRRRAALRRHRARAEELREEEGGRRRRPLRHGVARPLRRDRDRHGRRVHRRPDLGRERDVLRADDAVRVPARAHKVVGTDILHAAALLYVAGFGHIIAGNVDMHVVGWLLIGSIPGVLIGSQYSVRHPRGDLRLALADVLAISGLKLVQVPNVWLAVAIGAVGRRRSSSLIVRERGARRAAQGRSARPRPARPSRV